MPKKPHSDLDAWLATSRAPITTAISTILRNLQASDGEIADAIFHMCQSLAEMGPTLDSNFLTFLLEMMIATSGAETMTAEAEESRIRVLVGIIKRQNELIELFKARLQLWTSGFSEATASLEQEGSKVYFNKIGISLVMADRLNIVTDNMLDNFSAQLLQSVERYFQVSKIADIPNIPNHNRDLSSRRSGVLSNETASNMIATAMSTNTGASTLHSFANLLRYLGMTSVSTLLTTKISRKIGINPPEQLAAILWLTLAILDSRHVHSLVRLSSSTASNVLSQDLDATGEEQLIFLYPVCLDVMMMPSSGADWRVLLLSLEVFRKMANSLQSDFDPELVDVLLPLVSCLGHPNSTVQSFSVTCLNEISLACGYPSAQNLLLRNADYLINSIAMKINTFDVDPQVLQALTLLVKISDSAIIPYLADITDSIFSILLSHHGYAMLTRSSFDFLRSIITKLQELRASKAIDDDAKDRSKSTLTLRAVIEQLGCFDSEVSVDDVAVQTNTDWTDDNEIDRNTDKSGSPERCEDVQKRKIDDSTGLDMVRSIVELSQHYLMHESSELKVNLLGLIMEGSRLLCMDEDRYLPLVHQLWPVLINRLSDQQPSLRAATCDAISTICATAGDFVTTRLQDDWQQVRKIYDVTTAGFSIVVFETEIHALQGIPSTTLSSLNSLISMICSIATNVRLKDEQADELLDMLELFINYQPEVISALVALNVDLMWLHELQKQYKASVGVQWATPLGTNDVEFALLKE
ncbi:hypothetical protein MMC25_005412 [Agyrium rufum]|nr:hypothetical protein [Agyrium rufum]